MKKSRLISIVIAIAVGFLSLFIVRQPSKKVEKVEIIQKPKVETVEVIVLKRNVKAGEKVSSHDLEWRKIPKNTFVDSMILKNEKQKSMDRFIDKIARHPLYSGETLRPGRLYAEKERYLSVLLTRGKRGFAIKTSDDGSKSVGGFILPNDRVDLYLSPKNQLSAQESLLLFENIRVLAVNQKLPGEVSNPYLLPETITVELTPEEIETLLLAMKENSVVLALRSISDYVVEREKRKKIKKSFDVIRFGVVQKIKRVSQ